MCFLLIKNYIFTIGHEVIKPKTHSAKFQKIRFVLWPCAAQGFPHQIEGVLSLRLLSVDSMADNHYILE